ncbi:MAG: hypothetical protein IT553_09990 [Sphingomonadaceae bacterium]|nr:hypothetical protein [Sphingomonadaceae bacterium]
MLTAALLTSLIACFAAAFGGRWARLAACTPSGSALHHIPALITALIAAAIAAYAGAMLAAQFPPRPMLLLSAMALGFAALPLFWRIRPVDAAAQSAMGRPMHAAILLAAAMWGDGAHFVILALAAWTQGFWLAAIGGFAGILAAWGATRWLSDAFTRWLYPARLVLAALLLLAAMLAAMRALASPY